MFKNTISEPGKSRALTLRVSFLCYSDAINLAKSNTALNVMNNILVTFFFRKVVCVLGIYEN